MPLALLQGDASEVRRELARLGLSISPNRTARDLLASYLQITPVEKRARCVDKLGWQNNIFVTASETIGDCSELVVYQNTHAIEPALSISGTIEEWRNSIGRLAAGNSRLVFAISMAFAPTLAKIVNEESGGFHFKGASSSGKTTALRVAASVWGNPASYSRLWRSTANGLEGLAALHNDGLLILDELSQMDPKEAGDAAYLLANGQGKTRATRYGTVQQTNKWSVFFLSAGEESLSSLMTKAGHRINAGQEIRLADIDADAGFSMGMFQTLHEYNEPIVMAIALKEYSSSYFGAVGIAWLKEVVKNRHHLVSAIQEHMKIFFIGVFSANCSGQVMRVARRFALIAAAGELASSYGLTGWRQGEAIASAYECFDSWLESFGSEGNREDKGILAQVRSFFESYGASRFDNLNSPNNERINHRAGFYTTAENGDRIYMVLSEVFKKEICQNYDLKMVTKTLSQAGWIIPGNDGKSSQKIRVRGIGIPRLYVFTGKIWSDEQL